MDQFMKLVSLTALSWSLPIPKRCSAGSKVSPLSLLWRPSISLLQFLSYVSVTSNCDRIPFPTALLCFCFLDDRQPDVSQWSSDLNFWGGQGHNTFPPMSLLSICLSSFNECLNIIVSWYIVSGNSKTLEAVVSRIPLNSSHGLYNVLQTPIPEIICSRKIESSHAYIQLDVLQCNPKFSFPDSARVFFLFCFFLNLRI